MLFFPRLRRQAKWVFLALAIVFAGGFVFFGVGSGSTGIGDLFRGDFGGIFGGGGGGTSISKLQKTVEKTPGDAAAWLKLAQALQAKDRTDEAVVALEHYTGLRPKDSNGWQQLAALYLLQAQNYFQEIAQVESELAAVPGAGFFLGGDNFLAQEFQKNALYAAVIDALNKRLGELQTKFQGVLSAREGAWAKAVKTLPASDPSVPGVVFQWARAAEDAQDYKTALKAYQRYLQLVPEGDLAPEARAAIKKIKKILKSQSSSSAG
jgi:tetratricopeptide (TPR) repeat protein